MRTAVTGCGLLVLGAVAVATGILPPHDAAAMWNRVWPLLLFLVGITVVTELAAQAGVFQFIAQRTARWGAGRGWLLWLLVVLVAVVCTIFLSLDTTAVLLTPVVVLLARHVGLSPLPFAITTVWLANTASLLLPVSNLTNLLAQHAVADADPARFAALTALPALVAIIIPAAAVFLLFRTRLMVRYVSRDDTIAQDRPLFVYSGVVTILLLPALVSGVPVWIASSAAAVLMIAGFAVRAPRTLTAQILPWQLLLLACGIFFVFAALHALGLHTLVGAVAGHGSGPLDLLRLAAVGAAGANLVNNLPAYLAVEPIAGSPIRLVALLIGVNAGALITPWASLATLLWHRRLVALDVAVPWWRYALLGVVAAPVTVVAAALTLAWASGA